MTVVRRAFSTLESVLVLALLAGLALVLVPRFASQSSPAGAEAAARASLATFLTVENAVFERDGAFSVDPSVLATFGADLSFVTDPAESTGAQTVSITATAMTAAAAVSAGDGVCWYVRTSFAAPAGTEPVLWAVDDSAESCRASNVLEVVSVDGTGASPSSAYQMP